MKLLERVAFEDNAPVRVVLRCNWRADDPNDLALPNLQPLRARQRRGVEWSLLKPRPALRPKLAAGGDAHPLPVLGVEKVLTVVVALHR